MIENDFDIPFIADLALREKQIQQNYRPVIAVHKWFARRPGTLFRGLLLAEFGDSPVAQAFYRSNIFAGRKVCDPFMGGGTPLLEANRLGCDVLGYDINPMAHWVVSEELEDINLSEYRKAAHGLRIELGRKIGHLYRTRCLVCGAGNAHVKYFLWVKVQGCPECHKDVDLFPGYLVAEDVRHPLNVLVCHKCGELSECAERTAPGRCRSCEENLTVSGTARRNRCDCPHCGAVVTYPDLHLGAPRHRMFAIEYHCRTCKPGQKGRFFKKPDSEDLEKLAEAEAWQVKLKPEFVPTEEIPAGDETDRLHRWGYRSYAQMFNARQLIGLELSCQIISKQPSERIRHALATNLSDLLRYQNMLCRYDTMALKSLDIFSVHGFPVGLVQCESNLLGIATAGRISSVGSGGWANIIDKYAKAKQYCEEPFEVRVERGRKIKVPIRDEWTGAHRRGLFVSESRDIELQCGDAAQAQIAPESLDAVLTDPPYYGNVQYAELMDFCYVWLRSLTGEGKGCFAQRSTRNEAELTGNNNMNRGIEHFTEGLSAVFSKMASALKAAGPLAFTYHHNSLEAYAPIAVALLDAGFSCTASLPCPAEMGASIHINGTGSSIIDTVFVCRKTTSTKETEGLESLPALVEDDRTALLRSGLKVSAGDLRCICYGHVTRLTVQHFRSGWDQNLPTPIKLDSVVRFLRAFKVFLPAEIRLSEKGNHRIPAGQLIEPVATS